MLLALVHHAVQREHHSEGDDGGEPGERTDVETKLAGGCDQNGDESRYAGTNDEPAVYVQFLGDQLACHDAHWLCASRWCMTFATKISSRLMRCTSRTWPPRKASNSSEKQLVVRVVNRPSTTRLTMCGSAGNSVPDGVCTWIRRQPSRKRSLSPLEMMRPRSMKVMQSEMRSTSAVLCDENRI